ncbi:RRP15-like protein [Anneissia japonica]|uniref:RRP15-like protein n=1 Tax=Anneissia japonica TaxID=1529436 RepID=UPI0014258268|nr:RRP15-like protein [Anneissia japonica]
MAQSKVKRKRVSVSVSYNSGSEGDIESDEGSPIHESTKKNRKPKLKETPDEFEDETEVEAGEGWADAMAKILQKTVVNEGSAILAKSKSHEKEKKKEKDEYEEKRKIKYTKKAWEDIAYVKPNVEHKDIERSFQRTATRGVVQLFNAVKKEQKTLESKLTEVGASERKRAKVESSMSKGQFLNLLKKSASKTQQATGDKETQGSSKKSGATWDVLRDNFMMGATLKDWDKESESETENNDRT